MTDFYHTFFILKKTGGRNIYEEKLLVTGLALSLSLCFGINPASANRTGSIYVQSHNIPPITNT